VAKDLRDFAATCGAEQLRSFRLQRFDLDAKRNAPDGSAAAGSGGQFEFYELAFVEEGNMADFVEIVVFRGHPENRNSVDAPLGQVLGHAGGSNCFVNRIARSAEKAGLLTRD